MSIKQNILIIPPNTRGSGEYVYVCTRCYKRFPDLKSASEADRWGCTGLSGRAEPHTGTVEKMRLCLLGKKRNNGQINLF